MPKDFPEPMIHARIVDGGLWIPRIADITIKRRNDLLERLKRGHYFADMHVQVLLQSLEKDETIPKDDSWDMYSKLDGKGLKSHSNNSGYRSKWVREPFETTKSKYWTDLTRTRAGMLENPARMNKEEVPRCQHGCVNMTTGNLFRATLNHILGRCNLSLELRNKRHDRIVLMIKKKLVEKKFKVLL